MKVSELSGAELDYWVARANGLDWAKIHQDCCLVRDRIFAPSRSWQQGGPIIEREHINPSFYDGTPGLDDWSADIGNPAGRRSFGPTPLIAAMRCYVASRFGETVEG